MARTSQAACIAAIQAVVPAAGTWYLDLSNVDPGTTGATGLATTRQTFTASAGSAAIPSVVSNTNPITVPTAGTLAANFAMLYDSPTGGNFRTAIQLSPPVTATSINFAVGALQFTGQ